MSVKGLVMVEWFTFKKKKDKYIILLSYLSWYSSNVNVPDISFQPLLGEGKVITWFSFLHTFC